ncbi:helix-turn-helix domain-containing protein [Varibaculum cambriense]|uniref:Helix-turn-helix domain-containing protein n=1 Tax=Varibaculum cambriense TaxID=184870 RepID=A0AAJ1EVW8_9ACTO|nr:helix-turn-helix domain-containing protein [Varibaculum cambriense]
MSIRAFTWAFDEVTGVNRGEKLVLLALAEFANDDDITWRARHEIARRALCSDRSLSDYLASLEAKGFIEREARYRWCDSVEGACEGRPSHKHRCGTTYRVRRDRKSPVNIPPLSTPANSAGVAKKSVCAGSATDANFAGVAPQPQNSGVHTSKLLQPYDSYNRQLINSNPPTPQASPVRVQAGLVGNECENTSARLQQSCDAGSMHPRPSEPDWDVIRDCLPEPMRGLSTSAAIIATCLLRERLDHGWSSQALQRFIGQDPLPDMVKNLSGLVCWRIENTPVCPPGQLTTKPQVVPPLEEEERDAEPLTVATAREVAWFFTPAVLGVNESAVGNEEHWREQAKRILAVHGNVFDQAILAGESVPQSLRKAVRAGDSRG